MNMPKHFLSDRKTFLLSIRNAPKQLLSLHISFTAATWSHQFNVQITKSEIIIIHIYSILSSSISDSIRIRIQEGDIAPKAEKMLSLDGLRNILEFGS